MMSDDQPAASQRDEAATPAADQQARIAALESRVEELEREVASERGAATDYMQRWQRAQADFSNLKRRMQQEQEQSERLAGARALAGILPAVDSFERAFATLPPTLRSFSWIDGIGLVHLQLHGALQAAGIRAFAPERGAAFDPRTQQAIGEVETRDAPPGTIAVIVQQGFALGDLVLRPALVQLARAPQSAPGEEAQSAPQAERPAASSADAPVETSAETMPEGTTGTASGEV